MLNRTPAQAILAEHLSRLSLNFLLHRYILLLAIAIFFFNTIEYVAIIHPWLDKIYIVVFVALFFLANKTPKLNEHSLAEHLNRIVPQFEESTQLLFKPSDDLSVLQHLQYQRIEPRLLELEQQKALATKLPKKNLLFSFSALVFATSLFYLPQASQFNREKNQGVILPLDTTVAIESQQIDVFPPKYTALTAEVYRNRDIEVIEGSKVRWSFEFNDDSKIYSLAFADGLTMALQKQPDNRYFAEKVINKTGLYSVVASGKTLPEVYSLSVIKDQQPRVRVINPVATLVEIELDGDPNVAIEAMVQDDFGITEVKILASVAKGSGEAVKFRDEEFLFDDYQLTDKGRLYQKHWDLKALGMESGDEVYFTVIATDNKAGQGQTARSKTVIVRWLDEEERSINIEGISISYMPEFFRSQRQIIIETEQLIADKNELATPKFKAESVSLGHSQNDLKLKYGQYLGIEQDEGAGAWGGGASAEATEQGDEDEHQGHSHEHEHESPDAHEQSAANGSQQEVLAQFAHTHEDVHIGEVSSQNPKAMMKKAVSNMWQAELHLMMHEPDLALPYEKQAYKYLKLAQQAERVYVKRLGFEPPPVSEQRRLTGKLDQIKTRSETTDNSLDAQSETGANRIFQQSFALLNALDGQKGLTKAQRNLLSNAKSTLTDMAQQRANLIRHAATIEKVLISDSLKIDGCEDCVVKLKQKLWQLIDSALATPLAGQQPYLNSDGLIEEYHRLGQSGGER